MESKTVYEKYKKAMLEFYNRMSRDGYRGNQNYAPLIDKDETRLLIQTNSSSDRLLHPQGVSFRYDNITKDLLVELGQQQSEFNEFDLEKVRERLTLLYHSDGTMDVTHFSESNLSYAEGEENDIMKRTYMATHSYGKGFPGVSFDKLIDETDIINDIDTEYFEKLHRALLFQAPEFDIDVEKMKEDEDYEQGI